MDCVSLSQIHTIFCWDKCVMVKYYYCHPNEGPMWVSPCGGPSRAFFGPAPLDTLDGRDNLHLSSWLSGLYCFRRSAACTSSSVASQENQYLLQASVICNRVALRLWYLQGKQCKGAPLDEGQGSWKQASNNEFSQLIIKHQILHWPANIISS